MDAKLEAVYRQIPKTTCPPGCGECCGILWPSVAELRNIHDWLKARGREYIDFTMLDGDTCPYLDEEKKCSIYPVRPFLCRIMGASVNLPCPLEKCRVERQLNTAQTTHLYKAIYMRGKQKPLTEKHRRLIREVFAEVAIGNEH